MKIKVFRALWGMEAPDIETALKMTEDEGYDGFEAGAPYDEKARDQWKEAFTKVNLEYVAQVWTRGDISGTLGQSVSTPLSPEKHIDSMRMQMDANTDMENLMYIDAQLSRDYFSFEDSCKIIEATQAYAEEKKVKICYETHRCCFSFTPFTMRTYLDKYPWMRVTADFSNWCCACESMLEGQEDDVDFAIERADHVHARVGYEHGPQITDPSAPEWKYQMDRHLGWWEKIVEHHKKRGSEQLVFTPEFGPPTYMHTIPHTGQPVSDNWKVNAYVKDLIRERFGS